jgi:hypothetical protein
LISNARPNHDSPTAAPRSRLARNRLRLVPSIAKARPPVISGTEDALPEDQAQGKASVPWVSEHGFAAIAKEWIGQLGSRTNQTVFEALLWHADSKTGEARPGLDRLSALSYGLERKHLKRALKELERFGAITVVSRGSGRTSSRYRINPPPVGLRSL